MTRRMRILAILLTVCSVRVLANTADFIAQDVCLGTETVFTSTSTASNGEFIVSWDWDLDGDGNADFDEASGPVVDTIFPNAGQIYIRLRITTNLGNEVVRGKVVTVHPAPLANFVAPDVCKGVGTVLTNASVITDPNNYSIVSWEWDFDPNDADEYLDASGQSVTHDFGNSGSYTAGLRVTSMPGSCQSTTSKTVVVDPVPSVSFDTSEVCLGDQTVLSATANVNSGLISSYVWELNGNGQYDDGTGQEITHQFISDGNYQVSVRVTSDQGCVADTTQLVVIAPYPYINFSFNTACENQPIQFNNFSNNVVGTIEYDWTFGGFATSDEEAPEYTFNSSGTFPVTLVGTTLPFGCVSQLTQNVTVSPAPTADFTATEVCIGKETGFGNTSIPNGGSIQSYLWDFDGEDVSVATNPVYVFDTPGEYDVTLVAYSTAGCRDTITRTVNVWKLPEPEITANGPLEFCDGGQVGLEVNPVGTPTLWSTGEQAQSIVVSTGNTYTVVIIDDNGCRGETDIDVTVFDLPVITASNDTTVSLGEDVPLWASGANTYTWSPDTYLDNAFSDMPISSPTENLSYTVTGEDLNGCTSTEEVNIEVLVDYNLKPVNLFTPNNDGVNENFFVDNIDQYADCGITVYNRYGNEVYSSKPYVNDWPGTFNNSPLPEGAYYYVIDCDGLKDRFDGSVTILRDK